MTTKDPHHVETRTPTWTVLHPDFQAPSSRSPRDDRRDSTGRGGHAMEPALKDEKGIGSRAVRHIAGKQQMLANIPTKPGMGTTSDREL